MRFHRILALSLWLPGVACSGEMIISEIMYNPTGTKAEWIEVTNLTTNRRDMALWRLSGGANFTLPDFDPGNPSAHFIKERERIILSSKTPAETRADYPGIPNFVRVFGPWVGSLNNGGEELFLKDKNGATLCEVEYGDGGRKWPAAPDGTGHSLVVVDENRAIDDWHNWTSSATQGGTPGTPTVVPSEDPISDPSVGLPTSYLQVVPMTATWSFYKETAAPPADWNTLAFTPSAPWGSGPALLGFETAALPAPGLQTAVQTPNLLTYYFRTTFNWTGGSQGAQFQIDSILDDGATYYINGVYIGNKDGVPAVVHDSSVATATITDAALVSNSVVGNIPAGVLVDGTNVFAAVALQVNRTSSDMIFGSNLRLANVPPAPVLVNEVRQGPAGIGFIEFYNPGGTEVNLNGHYLSDTAGNWTKFPITTNLMVPAGGLATIGFAEIGFSPTATTTTIYMAHPSGTPFLGMSAALPQDGRSVGRKPVGASSWFRFSNPTPGAPNNSAPVVAGETPLPTLNEVHFHSTTGNVNWVEFTNLSTTTLNLSGYFVASKKDFSDKVPLAGSIPAGGYASTTVNFPTDAGRIVLYVIDSNNNVVDEAQVRRRAGRSSSQAWPRGSDEWYATTTPTQNAVNVPERQTGVQISEIMYAPPSDHRQGEFIELTNNTGSAIDLSGWRFDSGIDFTFPAGTSLPANGRLVVAQDPAYITANYPSATQVVGPYSGSLSNATDLIRLEDAVGNLADEVDYHSGGNWPRDADSLGSSLELIHPGMDNDCGNAWAASNEQSKGAWTTFTYTGRWTDGGSGFTPTERQEIHFNLVGDGHLVLRNITFGPASGTKVPITTAISPTNSGTSSEGWRVTGTHYLSFSDAEGLHIVATGQGDMKGNAIEIDTSNMTAIGDYTISFQARWVSGMNRLVMCTWDRSWGRTFAVPIPNNLGTPGAANSRAVALEPPNVWNMLHSPAVPKASDDVKITAKVTTAGAPIANVSVVHRLDTVAGNNAWSTTQMLDNGTGGDARAGDGIYTATISNYKTEGAIAQFYIQATSQSGGIATYPPGGAAKPGHWIVDSTPEVSDLLVKRYIVAQRDHDSMGSNGATAAHNFRHPRMSNHYYNATLIHNEKEITYNVEVRKYGSPWTRDGGNSMDRIRCKFPKDRLFRGREKSGADNDAADSGARRWNNRVNLYWLYLLGYEAAETEFVQVKFNNLGLALKDDTEPTDTDMLDRTYGNSGDTELHEIDDAWYFGDSLTSENRTQVNGDWVVTVANLDSSVYWHGSWPIRTQAERYDFSSLISWIRACYNNGITPANDSEQDAIYRASVEAQFDIDKFARYAAIKGWAGAWDNFTINRGKNGYVYRRPTDGRWEFHFWDGDLDFQNTGEAVLGSIPGTGPLFSRPWFRRQMNYYLQEIRDKWSANSPRMSAWLQAMEDQSPSYTINQTYYTNWFTNRRPTIDGFIGSGNQNAAFTATASVGASTTLNFTNITGTAPSTVFNITVDGQPDAVLTWVSQNSYRITGVFLRLGTNTLTLRSWDRLGGAIGSTSVTVTKTGDAPPILKMAVTPPSLNAVIGESVLVDSVGSFDPEGTNLARTWLVSPSANVTNVAAGATGRRLLFSTPGIYTVTLSATDGAGSSASLSKQISVSATADFNSFGDGYSLPAGYTATNVENRDNDSPASWFSLEDSSGRLLIQISENAPASLDGAFPHITRPLPTSSNWVLQTDPSLETRQLGNFDVGLVFDMIENGQPARYVFSITSGNQLSVKRGDASNYFYSPPTAPSPIRINCGGPQVTETDGKIWVADYGFVDPPPTSTVTQAFNPTTGGTWQHYGLVGDTRRIGVSDGPVVYEIPVPAWPNGYLISLNTAVVSATAQSFSLGVSVNDTFQQNWSFSSSGSQMRQLNLASSYTRNLDGKLKISLVRNAGTTTGAQSSISAIEITPSATPPSSNLPPLPPAPVIVDALRVERVGNSLIFSRKTGDTWIVHSTLPIPAGSTAVKGGVFASTERAEYLRAGFDYLLVGDPGISAPILAALRLTEVMYNPGVGGVEYLEFKNFGTSPINLQGVNFPATIPFTSGYTFGNESLAPGEFIVLTADPATFRHKYGVSPRLALTGWTAGSLNNGGERVLLSDGVGNTIHDFTYDDVAPWPLPPDGQGPSLEVIDPFGNYNDPLNWRASASSDGSPGGDTRLTDPDTDGDGVADWIENAFGLASNSPGRTPTATSSLAANGQVTISWPFIPTRWYSVEVSPDLVNWNEIGVVQGAGSFIDIDSPVENRRYYRIFALPYP